MKFANENKAILLDFIIGLECLSPEFNLKMETNYKKIETIEFYKIYKDIFSDIQAHLLEFNKVFTSPFYPALQSIYRLLYQKHDIKDKETFLKLVDDMSSEDIIKAVKMQLNILKLSDKDAIEYIHSMAVSGDIKYYLLEIFRSPKNFKKNINKVFELIFPIFEKHYKIAKDLFITKEKNLLKMDKDAILEATSNFLGSEKLSDLQFKYNNLTKKDINPKEIEIVPLLLGANRICIIPKGLESDTSFHPATTSRPAIYCLGLDSINSSEKMKEAEKISKQVLKSLSDDTRLDILRMISFGLNTNKKLSKFFQVSPPAITYQTNNLKEAGIIDTDDNGCLFVNRRNLEKALKKIEELLSLKGNN